MPTPKDNESEKDFVGRCIPIVMNDGTAQDNKQAAAICFSMWREHMKGKSLSLSVTLKTDPTSGRVRWKAIANSGEFDAQGDRFDESFFDDIVSNFWAVQDAVSRGEATLPGFAHPEGMPVPQLDVAHYSFQLQRSARVKARVGVPTFAYRDGHKMILQGHFEATPLGAAASKSILADKTDVIKTSIGVWPDWNRVETLSDGRRIFKGGANMSYLDHLALTAHPVDARTQIEAEGQMLKSLKVSDDALEVLGDEKLVAELEQARAAVKSDVPDGALSKAVKTVGGKDFPASDFLVVEDAAKPDTWHLQVKENGVPNHTLMGGAYAALLSPGGHRGNKYAGPNKADAEKKLHALYDSEKMTWPGDTTSGKSEAVAESIVTITEERTETSKDVTTVEKDAAADAIDQAQAAADVAAGNAQIGPQGPDIMMQSLAKSIEETQSAVAEAIKALGTRVEVLEKSLPNLSAINDLATALNKSIEATQANEAQKVKSLLDNRGWLDIVKLYSARSAKDNTVDNGARAKGPQEADPNLQLGGPIAGRFIKT